MRRMDMLLPGLLLGLLLGACGGAGEPEAAPTPEQIARAICDSQGEALSLTSLEAAERGDYLAEHYDLEGVWEDAAVYTASGADVREIAVVLMEEDDDANGLKARMEDYLIERQGDFFGYFPDQAKLLDEGRALVKGRYAALIVCEDMPAAEAAFYGCLEGGGAAPASGPPAENDGDAGFKPPNETDMTLYDTEAIRRAWESGDAAGLSERDADILARCREVLDECVSDGMSDFQKELAIHDWLVEWGEYDQTVYDDPDHAGREGNRDPYGMLVGGYGICLGYATTFQLLMDLAGVECITVVGASFQSTSDHAWNMVRLDGEWYCVDPTWDDPSGGAAWASPSAVARRTHRCFNVTSRAMRESDHQWDETSVPEATAEAYRWDGVSKLPGT